VVVDKGDKLHIIVRRNFEGDLRRHFVGEVEEVSGTLVRLAGYAFIHDPWANEFLRKPECRVRILSLADAGLVVNVLPRDVVVEKVRYRTTVENRLVVSDGSAFALDFNEFGTKR
jgi:hypothetical protein